MALKRPPEDLPQAELAASLAKDEDASVVGHLDLGLDDDPDLKTRTGMQSTLKREPEPKRGFPAFVVVLVLAVLGAAGAWMAGALDRFGLPPP